MPPLLPESEIARLLATIPDWDRTGAEIVRTFSRADFREALAFVNLVAGLAEEADHHPDIDIRWNKVTLRLSTHSRGGLTLADFDLAARIDLL